MQNAQANGHGGAKSSCLPLRMHVFFPTIMYYGIITTGGLVALPIGIISMEMHGSCLLYGHVKWVKNTTFIPILDRPVPCHFVVSLQAISSIIWGICMAGYHTYSLLMEPETTATVLKQLCFSVINIPTSLLMLVAACVTSDGYRHFCASLMKTSRIERCADGENDAWRQSWWFKTREDSFTPKFAYYYQMAEAAMWANFGLWTMQALLSTVPMIIQRRLLVSKLIAVRYKRSMTARSSLTGLSSNPGSPRRMSTISEVNYKFSIQVGDLEDIEELSSDGELLELPAISKRDYNDSVTSEDEVHQSLKSDLKTKEHESVFSQEQFEKEPCECSRRKAGFLYCNTSTTLVSMDGSLPVEVNSDAQLSVSCSSCNTKDYTNETHTRDGSCVSSKHSEISIDSEKEKINNVICASGNIEQIENCSHFSNTFPSISERMTKSVVEFTIGEDGEQLQNANDSPEINDMSFESITNCRLYRGGDTDKPGSWPMPRKAYQNSRLSEKR
ncbi:uncharacterized protein LOC106151615 [Lingula anatina]|uniref:Uncharacterized protein LOC106151615 n=1 Tax=Lingula anatina TaxID=7574 RepID=A0A1S3H5K4_LINAN|nr:uncharacterized protein LOC106151615 [Lingula anatina]XP_013380413.1 uncharacterized protein LOC106151615 [Lingula anatina]XP_013380414.1 uncharacterized protein LOC106151615 [Lingula anatina]XP_013380416.1 uncharacterized protein LOC106151615 [Lingula anatina]XP_013380417.1 uncharacterized protein LOC106151615 [Lingula anatina]XP_013380418.1 uncharacterized protein LOC106151615 [Lingula anatina]XP_013380419.1 uncharacterized protein LOC106151615 [Lingula anatina]XP_013380420.1 uncharacte|eukprot:XP_013380412.1 uncharacterized protein LOC106151615 [Lingula anatina]